MHSIKSLEHTIGREGQTDRQIDLHTGHLADRTNSNGFQRKGGKQKIMIICNLIYTIPSPAVWLNIDQSKLMEGFEGNCKYFQAAHQSKCIYLYSLLH